MGCVIIKADIKVGGWSCFSCEPTLTFDLACDRHCTPSNACQGLNNETRLSALSHA